MEFPKNTNFKAKKVRYPALIKFCVFFRKRKTSGEESHLKKDACAKRFCSVLYQIWAITIDKFSKAPTDMFPEVEGLHLPLSPKLTLLAARELFCHFA